MKHVVRVGKEFGVVPHALCVLDTIVGMICHTTAERRMAGLIIIPSLARATKGIPIQPTCYNVFKRRSETHPVIVTVKRQGG